MSVIIVSATPKVAKVTCNVIARKDHTYATRVFDERKTNVRDTKFIGDSISQLLDIKLLYLI